MKSLVVTLVCAAALLLFGSDAGLAQDFNTGLKAAEKGKFDIALREWRALAQAGDPQAQFYLARLYAGGQGVLQSDTDAVKWYRKAAVQGYAQAQANLGAMYEDGSGIAQDRAQAAMWYKKSAAQGSALAHYNLGVMYAKGEGVWQDDLYAYMWSSLAADAGDQDAAHNLDALQAVMTAKQIAKAQALARKCLAKTYVGC